MAEVGSGSLGCEGFVGFAVVLKTIFEKSQLIHIRALDRC